MARSDGGVSPLRTSSASGEEGPLRPLKGAPPRSGEYLVVTNAARCERVGYHGRYNGRTIYEYRLRDKNPPPLQTLPRPALPQGAYFPSCPLIAPLGSSLVWTLT